ncbi:MAG: 3-oxoadipyl-CoA thiolase [Alphaproteobacteria bacterium]|nr:MAG: 3-oxoadipyl-CoA thiolase [Alphaproteobacteria bacterium]
MSEAFLIDGIRSPIGRFGGALASIRADDLAAHCLKGLMARHPKIDLAEVDEVILGCTNQAGEDSRNVARMALLLAGFPPSAPGVTINRLCASGLEAVAGAARRIKCGEADLVIAGGVENMSRAPLVMAKGTDPKADTAKIYDSTIGWRFINEKMHKLFGTDQMPETAENLAEEFKISREDQDAYAYRSQLRTAAAKESGFIGGEILPVETVNGPVVEDEHPRPGTTLEILAGLKTPFREGGTVTAGNASGINDGAAALLVASEKAVKKYELKPLARIIGSAAAGVEPRIMGIGPIPATTKLLKQTSLSLQDMDLIEINEAFAVQVLACLRQFGLPDDAGHVNPNGGAIALGHPLGMSGARLVLTASRELSARKGKYGLVTMCVGVGQGASLILERV